jgi:hypothetical protein
MVNEPLVSLLILTLLWFVAFWIVGGVIFAVIGLVRFLRLNKNRFSCLFTFASAGTAFGAAWMGLWAVQTDAPTRYARIHEAGITELIPRLFTIGSTEILSAAGLWFLLLLAAGIFLLFISRAPERPRDIHGND